MTPVGRRRLVVGNWKMNLGERDARALVTAVAAAFPFERADGALAPAFPCLRAALDAARGSALAVAAQNVHPDDRGAYTGEVSAPMLAEMGIRFVIVGHSERRILFGEDDATIARKLVAARSHGLVPILCIGESEGEHDRGETHDVVVRQLRAAVGTDPEVVIAYEPVWAIGTGRTPAPSDVAAAHGAIREELMRRLGPPASAVRILYGGSVNAANAAGLLAAENVDGALVGGASLDAVTFVAIASA